ncbi:MAG TPA: hypothetical protein VGP99_01465, partial [Tepidisphaeraceae bacterium]|nr:hypothetical protein [Tepidisphaeraceae bacterium]
LGELKVVGSTPDRLVLKKAVPFSKMLIAFGLLVTAAGFVASVAYLREARQQIPRKFLLVPLVGPAIVVIGAAGLYRRKAFDGKRRGIITRGMFGKTKLEPWDAYKHIQVTVIPADEKRRETVEVRMERLGNNGPPEVLGALRTTKKALALIWAAEEISRLLTLPVKVVGDAVEGASEICSALEILEGRKSVMRAA